MSATLAWGQPLTWSEALAAERTLRLAADPAALRRIAGDLDLETLASLTAELTLRPWLDGVELSGWLRARMTRLCGLSLEPFEATLEEPMRIRLVPAGSPNAPRAEAAEVIVDLEAEDPPDECLDGVIDLAAYVREALALGLDPFPRKPGAVFSPPTETAVLTPFAALARLKESPPQD